MGVFTVSNGGCRGRCLVGIEITLVGDFTVMNVCVMSEETNLPRSADRLSVRGGVGRKWNRCDYCKRRTSC